MHTRNTNDSLAGGALTLRLIADAFALLLFGSLMMLAPAAPAAARQSGPPPLIDRQLFFGDPEIAGARLSPDGKFIAFVKPLNGVRNIWVKRTEEPFDAARPVTADTKRPIPAYFWSEDGKYILFVQDQGGDENFNVYAVDPAAKPAAGQQVPPARNLTDAKEVQAAIYAVPESEPDAIYVGLNDRDKAWHDLYKVKISTGERTLLRKNTERLTGWVFDLKDQLRLATRAAENGDTEVLRVDADGFKKIYTCNVFESCGPVRFHKDGRRVYMETNKGDVDLTRLVLLDPETGKEELVEADPSNRVDFGSAFFSDVTDEIVATIYNDDRVRIYWKDKEFEADYNHLKRELPGKEINFVSKTKDERLWLIAANSDTDPGSTYLYDRPTKKLTLQYRIREKLPREHLAEMKVIRYKSSDGLEIPAYLTLPKGIPAKRLPLVVVPHGGPWGRDSWGYNPFAQFLANRGYAVLQPNFRASTGFGKKFINAGNNEWGQKMQDDLTWGVKHLVAEGIADPKRVGIMGGSYGGYATLAGLAFTPEVYAAGVSIVGPSNLITLLNSIPPYWESIRKLFTERMGDPATPAGRAQLERQSPLNSAAKIKAPLLVIQGANDPRVKKAESDQIVVVLRERGFPVEYLVAPDEGHGFARPVNNMAMFAASEKFLAKHLGGRFQEDMTPETATRLKEITVDVKTVELPKKVEAAAVGLPKPVADLKPGTTSYKAGIAVAGQNLPMTVTTEVKEEGGRWVVNSTAKAAAFGEMVDKTTYEKGSLVPVARWISQGPVVVDLQFKDGKATGTLTVSGQAKPVSVELGGQLFADGAGAHPSLAALPLAEGYTTTFRNFDVQAQKVKLMQLKVAGAERVTVPAGTFDALKLEITSAEGDADKTTVWVDKATRQVLKVVAVLPAMSGAVITSELTQ
ncbi:MAG: prolyl oligopeptidase family serine peptidase [Acidobacteriota bacterium]|nr:prolyl oligopeptidase family serine peptidase [Acidobacteriota bacterium]